MLPWCGQLHNELFGRRHGTRQSHGLFALGKHLYSLVFICFWADVSALRLSVLQNTCFGHVVYVIMC